MHIGYEYLAVSGAAWLWDSVRVSGWQTGRVPQGLRPEHCLYIFNDCIMCDCDISSCPGEPHVGIHQQRSSSLQALHVCSVSGGSAARLVQAAWLHTYIFQVDWQTLFARGSLPEVTTCPVHAIFTSPTRLDSRYDKHTLTVCMLPADQHYFRDLHSLSLGSTVNGHLVVCTCTVHVMTHATWHVVCPLIAQHAQGVNLTDLGRCAMLSMYSTSRSTSNQG